MINLADLRYDTSQVGGTFYDTYTNAMALVGGMNVIHASLVLDSGWGGDQILTLTSATVNSNTFVPSTGGGSQTCDLPAATIRVTKVSGTSAALSMNRFLSRLTTTTCSSGLLTASTCITWPRVHFPDPEDTRLKLSSTELP